MQLAREVQAPTETSRDVMADVFLLMTSTGPERDREVHRVVSDMLRHPDDWRALDVPAQPGEVFWPAREVVAAATNKRAFGKYLDVEEPGRTEVQAEKQVRRACLWRADVTRTEAANEGRLCGLLWAVREAGKLVNAHPDTKALRGQLERLVAIVAEWGIGAIPATALEARELAERVCRNSRAMPREWREL